MVALEAIQSSGPSRSWCSGMTQRRLLFAGIVGAITAALCCFTPILVVLLSVVGLSAATGYVDYVLLPALAICIGIVIYALVRRKPANRGIDHHVSGLRPSGGGTDAGGCVLVLL